MSKGSRSRSAVTGVGAIISYPAGPALHLRQGERDLRLSRVWPRSRRPDLGRRLALSDWGRLPRPAGARHHRGPAAQAGCLGVVTTTAGRLQMRIHPAPPPFPGRPAPATPMAHNRLAHPPSKASAPEPRESHDTLDPPAARRVHPDSRRDGGGPCRPSGELGEGDAVPGPRPLSLMKPPTCGRSRRWRRGRARPRTGCRLARCRGRCRPQSRCRTAGSRSR
jgi:hypothetical protein